MTATSPSHSSELIGKSVIRTIVPIDALRQARRIWLAVTGIVLAMYLLLYNPFWVPGGDSELYVAVARNWVLGNGHTFNGQSVSICPPGWPLVLAGAMKISHGSFAVLKLITLLCMGGAMSIWYWILLRFTAPALAGLIVVTSAIIQHVYTLSFWMHSDALFCLLGCAAM